MQYEFTLKIKEYIRKIEEEISRKIDFIWVPKEQMPIDDATAVISMSSERIIVLLNSSKKVSNTDWEHCIPHEATHALLIYKHKYYNPLPKRIPTKEEQVGVGLLVSMVDDIVVDTIIQKEGFPPFSDNYLPQIQETTINMTKGIAYNKLLPGYPKAKGIFIVLRYVTAWGNLKYNKLDENAEMILRNYLKSYPRFFPGQYKTANQTIDLISQYDIFTSEGRNKTIEAVLKIWHYDNLIELVNL